jgi:hypothetical protein
MIGLIINAQEKQIIDGSSTIMVFSWRYKENHETSQSEITFAG